MGITHKIRRRFQEELRLLLGRFADSSAILLYHRVASGGRDPFGLCVSPSNFEEQMSEVAKFANPLPVLEFTRRQREGTLPARSVCVTFDDGFLDVRDNALPVLERHGIPAAVYCVSGTVGRSFWWDRLIEILFGADAPPATLRLEVSGREVEIQTAGRSRAALLAQTHRLLSPMREAERDRLLDRLAARVGGVRSDRIPRSMTAGELQEFSRHPLITIGAHTASHSRLASMPAEAQADEIASSLRGISTIVGQQVQTFSYPFGLYGRDFTKATMLAAASAGLDHALAADRGAVNRHSNPFKLPRLWVSDCGGESLAKGVRRWL